MSKTFDPFFDGYRHLRPLSSEILRDLARNECAPRDYRKAAVELLVDRKSPFVKHADLFGLVQELEVELDGIQFEFPAPEPGPGPLTTSITTATMFSDGPSQVKEELNAPRPEPV
jgi:hypothetical protein